MNIAILIGLSLAWGGLVVVTGAALQRAGLSGAMRQAMWRAAALMLAAPFAAAGVYTLLGPEVVEPVWTWGEGGAANVPIVVDPEMMRAPVAAPVVREDSIMSSLPDMSMLELILALIGLGWFVRAVQARCAAKELETVTREADAVHSQSILQSARKWSGQLGLHKVPELRLMSGDFSPFTQGVRRPIVYLPHGLECKLSAREMDLVIGHELMHVKRGDALWRPVERIVADILWFNPFAWFVRSELERARELACDEAMLKAAAPARDYARALVSVARFAAGLPARAPAAAMFPFNKDKALPERVKAATAGAGRSSKWAVAGMAAFMLVGVPLAIAQGAGAPKQRLPIPDFITTVVQSKDASISSHYGKREDPFTGKEKFHSGVDVKAKKGTPIYAPADAEVIFVGEVDGYGKTVKLRFNREWIGKFSQMQGYKVVEGQRVRAGDVIGLVGESGRATGPHVHIEVYGPSSSYDRTGELTAFNPVYLGLAPSLDQELNAAQIRELGIVLPETMPEAPSAPAQAEADTKVRKYAYAMASPSAAPIPPQPPKVLAIDPDEFKDIAPGSVIEFTQDDGSTVKIVKSKDGKSVHKSVKRIETRDLSEEERAALMEKLEGDHHISFSADGDSEGQKSFVFVTRDKGDDGNIREEVRSYVISGDEISEAEIEAIREQAHMQAEEARMHAEEMRMEAEEARMQAEEARMMAEEARRDAKERKREAKMHKREDKAHKQDELYKDQSLDLDGGPNSDLFQSLNLGDLIANSVELGLQEAGLALSDVIAEGFSDLDMHAVKVEALDEAIEDIQCEIDDLKTEIATMDGSGFEARMERAAANGVQRTLSSTLVSLKQQRAQSLRTLDQLDP